MQNAAAASAYDALPLQVWTARPDGALDYVNPCVTSYFCIDAARILEHGWKDLCHPLDLQEAAERWRRALDSGQPYEMAFRLLRGVDQQYRWHIARATAVRDESGAITHWVGTNSEIDSHKRAEEISRAMLERVQHEHQRWNALFAQTPVAVILTAGPAHHVEACSDAARQLSGSHDIGGRALADAFPLLVAGLGSGTLDAVYRGGPQLRRDDARLESVDGTTHLYHLVCKPVRDDEGTIDGLILVALQRETQA